jgi:surfeit locus 1 family protein
VPIVPPGRVLGCECGGQIADVVASVRVAEVTGARRWMTPWSVLVSAAMARYRFALRPKWILSHVFVVVMVAGCIAAMFWQISRLHQKEARNRRVTARSSQPAVPVGDLIRLGDPYSAASPIEFRPVRATGTYLRDQEVIVRGRSRESSPGSWILTPLDMGNGVAVTVNRGWVPNGGELTKVPKRYRAPSGRVTVEGYAMQTETRGSFGPRDPAKGTLSNLARADVARLDQQVPERLLPLYIEMQRQSSGIAPADPRPVPKPELDNGPHLSYSIQWALFSLVGFIGYPIILRRRANEIELEELEDDEDGDELDQADPDDTTSPGDPRLDPLTT